MTRELAKTSFGRSKVFIQLHLNDTRGIEPNVLQQWWPRESEEGCVRGTSTNSSFVYELAKRWLHDCQQLHIHCKVLDECPQLPKRLLELNKPLPGYLRLVNASEIIPRPSYMTLSHCWGNSTVLLLTKATEEALFKGLSLDVLALTFREFAVIADRLGSKYAWIDCLCIYQDSEDDWRREASSMKDVYRGSLCNIAATASKNSDEGCFRSRDPYFLQPCVVETQYSNAPNFQYLVEDTSSGSGTIWPDDDHLPLFKRAWVLQERLLAPCNLHFSNGSVFWECRTIRASEMYPRGEAKILNDRNYGPRSSTHLKAIISEHDQHNLPPSWAWGRIVEAYSQGNLTYSKDKLVAISGIAKKMTFRTSGNHSYFAGLWRETILHDMLWSGSGRHPRPLPYRAPSWSWASVDGRVQFQSIESNQVTTVGGNFLPRYKKALAEIVDIHVNHTTEDVFGQVEGGYIRLRGQLRRLQLGRDGARSPYESGSGGTVTEMSLLSQKHKHSMRIDENNPFKGIDLCVDVSDFTPQELSRLYFLPLLCELDYLADWRQRFLWFPRILQKTITDFKGLVLRPTGKIRGQYERVGTLFMYAEPRDPPWLSDEPPKCIQNPLSELSSSKLKTTEEFEYEDFDGKDYTISIV